jgi:CRP-like cAMP-binding protein
MHVLVADDSRVMRKIFRHALEGMGHADSEILEAADGDETTQILARNRPEVDLVIADWDLPGLDGRSLLGHLPSTPAGKETPVLFCVSREHRVSAEESPGIDFIERPFTDDVLQEKVRRLEELVRARRAKEGAEVLRTAVSAGDADLPFLIRLPSRLIEELLRLSTRLRHPAGAELLRPGQVVDSLHILTAGEVELVEEGGKVAQVCHDGDCFGELSFILNQPSRVGARARTPVEVASLTRHGLGEMVRRHPTMADYLSTLMSRRWKRTGTTRITRGEGELMGNLQSMPFADVVQLLHVTQKTGVLGLKDGAFSGGIYFHAGEVVHAWTETLKGDEAFYKMASWKRARFGFSSVPRKEPHTVEQPTMTLLMEAMRRLDEGSSGTAQGPA